MLRPIVVLVLSFFWAATLTAQTAPPEGKVVGNVVTSDRDPAVRIELRKAAQYVGADRWVLYGIADCELHAFVEADAQKSVQRLYWVQFEDYVPSRPDLHHTYDSPKHTTIGGMDFYADTWVRTKDATTQSGSDREHIEALVRAEGYRMPEALTYVRFVHLLDEEKRKELMIIYGEDLAPTGLPASELSEGAKRTTDGRALRMPCSNVRRDASQLSQQDRELKCVPRHGMTLIRLALRLLAYLRVKMCRRARPLQSLERKGGGLCLGNAKQRI